MAFFRGEVLCCVFVCSLLGLHLATTNYSVEDKVLTTVFWLSRKDVKKTPSTFVQGALNVLMVGRAGVEPTTNGLKVRCSTN